MTKKARLAFGAAARMSGFTALSTASFNDCSPARVIRELLQNSLDAAADANERTARVRFRVTVIGPKDVPDIKGYKMAFEDAVEDNKKAASGQLSDPAQQVVDNIGAALDFIAKKDGHMLSVMDNGVGLDEDRMTSLLGDGSSAKLSDSTGSYGVGHFTAVSASDLRYLIYGGVLSNGNRVASGLTVLAGRFGKYHPHSAEGYLVEKILGGAEDGKIYQFSDESLIPPVISCALDEIEERWGHGSAVMIPGFNYFGYPDEWLRDIVQTVVAYNFSAALHDEKLVVEVDETTFEGGEITRIGKNDVEPILEIWRDRQRSFRKNTKYSGLRPSGRNAWAAWKTLSDEKSRRSVETSLGPIDIALAIPAPADSTRIDLVRNGMWITDDIPSLGQSEFTESRPFHAVLLPKRGSDLHRLVRKAEGPMHNSLSFNLLSAEEKKNLKSAFRAIGDWIKSEVPKIDDEEYTPEDFLVVSGDGDGLGGESRQYALWGAPVVVRRFNINRTRPSGTQAETDPDEADTPPDKPSVAAQLRTRGATRAQPLPFRSTVVPMGRRKHGIEIVCGEESNEIVLRLRVDENVDATCERVLQDEYLTITSVMTDDATGRMQADVGSDRTEIRLRGVQANTTYRLTVEHDRPADLKAVSAPVFRVDLHKAPRVVKGRTGDDS